MSHYWSTANKFLRFHSDMLTAQCHSFESQQHHNYNSGQLRATHTKTYMQWSWSSKKEGIEALSKIWNEGFNASNQLFSHDIRTPELDSSSIPDWHLRTPLFQPENLLWFSLQVLFGLLFLVSMFIIFAFTKKNGKKIILTVVIASRV